MHSLVSFLSAYVDFAATGQILSPQPCKSTSHTQWMFPAAPRLVAVGDLHGDLQAAQRAFRLAGLVDEDGHWRGGSTVCVQVCNA